MEYFYKDGVNKYQRAAGETCRRHFFGVFSVDPCNVCQATRYPHN